jgi:hypothetical protein
VTSRDGLAGLRAPLTRSKSSTLGARRAGRPVATLHAPYGEGGACRE